MGPNGAEPAVQPEVQPRWYALAVRSRCEKGVARDLESRRVEVFLPIRSERRPWRDRIKTVELALFPGYVFVRAALRGELRYRILDSSDVVCVVGHSSERAGLPIPDREIESVRLLVESSTEVEPCEALSSGDRVMIAQGPLRGIECVVERAAGGRQRIVCSIELLGRAVCTTLGGDQLIPLD